MLIRNFKIDQKLMTGMNMYVNLYGITKNLELTNTLCFFYKSWYEARLTHVIDLLDENGIFYQWILFKRK